MLAVILTHGHEDHIGALPYLLKTIGAVPIYGARFTIGLVRSKLDEHKLARDDRVPRGRPRQARSDRARSRPSSSR